MPLPYITEKYIYFPFPLSGHVVENTVTSEGKENYKVDGELVIPVTSDAGTSNTTESEE